MLAWSLIVFSFLFHTNIKLRNDGVGIWNPGLPETKSTSFFLFFFLSVQDSEQTASLTENIKSQLNTDRDSLSTLKEKLKIEI